MKYFGILSLLAVVVIGVLWSISGLTGGRTVDENGQVSKPPYQEALDSAQEAADSLSEAGRVQISIYDGISFAPSTKMIDISGQNLTGSLKAEIRTLSNLEVLNISNNDFTGLPAEIGQLSKLKTLDISNNPLTGLPREIGQLQNLEVFKLVGVDYSRPDLVAIQAQFSSTTVVITE